MVLKFLLISIFTVFSLHSEPVEQNSCLKEAIVLPEASFWLKRCLPVLISESFEQKQSYALPSLILNWGSNGKLGQPWHFQDQVCEIFVEYLFDKIVSAFDDIDLNPHDLFHAHLIAYEHNDTQHLALVFHAKEYPVSLSGIKNFYRPAGEEFDVSDEEFQDRNFLYLSHTSRIYLINAEEECEEWFDGVNTISEHKIAENLPQGRWIGDVNYFVMETLERIKYRFFPGFHSYLSTGVTDLERMLTGKTQETRRMLNSEFDSFMYYLPTPSLVYFLTGVKGV